VNYQSFAKEHIETPQNALNNPQMKDGRSMTSFYYYSVNHQSGLQSNTFSKLSHVFLIYQKCATNYVITFEVYDGFIGQKILKL
jgi:hypothetical protein